MRLGLLCSRCSLRPRGQQTSSRTRHEFSRTAFGTAHITEINVQVGRSIPRHETPAKFAGKLLHLHKAASTQGTVLDAESTRQELISYDKIHSRRTLAFAYISA